MKQKIVRKGEFDFGHRILGHQFKCRNFHGHRGQVELEFEFDPKSGSKLGYAIDFGEIKRVGYGWIDMMMDHAMLLNPKDELMINLCKIENSTYYLMSLNGVEYCNPSAENISKEIYLAMNYIFIKYPIQVSRVRFFETPTCYVDCTDLSLSKKEIDNFAQYRGEEIAKYVIDVKGVNYECK